VNNKLNSDFSSLHGSRMPLGLPTGIDCVTTILSTY